MVPAERENSILDKGQTGDSHVDGGDDDGDGDDPADQLSTCESSPVALGPSPSTQLADNHRQRPLSSQR